MSIKESIEQFIIGLSDSLIGFFGIFKKRKPTNDLDDVIDNEKNLKLITSTSNNDETSTTKQDNIKLELSKNLHDNIFFICKLNGLVFLTVSFYLHYIFKPIMYWLTTNFVFTSFQFIFNFFISNTFDLVIIYLWSISVVFLYFLFQISILKEKKRVKTNQNRFILGYRFVKKIILNMADVLIVFVLETVLFTQSLMMCFIPVDWLRQVFFHVHFSYLLSFLVFNFKWTLMSWSLNTRINFMESRISYFLGFGLVISIIISLPDSFIYSAVLSSFLFPIFLFNAIETNCEHLKPNSIRFPIFDFTFSLFRFFSSFISTSKEIQIIK